ncbi:hypothetical protein ES707_22751 [subsurface metagenome]
MRIFYESFEIEVPANSELVMETITGREGALPYVTAVGRDLPTDTDFLLFVNDMMVIDVPYTMKMGFDNFLPFYYQLDLSDVVKAGFRNRTDTPNTMRFTLQYYYPAV